jgi:aldehyde:ferredoxin oxidoreductase
LFDLSPTQEYPSERYGSVPVDGPEEGFSILDHCRSKLKKYYKVMGWDEDTGMPHQKKYEGTRIGKDVQDA